ncbi:G protein-coupled receptor GPR1 [Sphaceloma murrayae]|uniref:G protein-coupled receptor GPR1 n=1 Tax=Sphaceloma murrayae TaxID=2082308 RepID=A0A2K1QMG2_9PEZI|nr:G protein-coupled receptor GPR1 [Sphaceloma murrayae]
MGLGGHNLNTSALLTQHHTIVIQHAAVAVASCSVAACVLSLYWFTLMRRNFRRTLVMLLIFSDLFKSSWLVVFPAVSLHVGGIRSGSYFCDIGGFFLQAGLESCDVAILLMSIHMSLQVFKPTSSRLGPDGLYRYRYAVYVIWVFLPSAMAALAFVRTGAGSYLSQGAFCTLPIRPFWYRLALSWIPRYLIWAYVTLTALRIYLHVGAGFSVFAREVDSGTQKTDQSKMSTLDTQRTLVMPKVRRAASYVSENIPFSFMRHQDSTHSPPADHGAQYSEAATSPPTSPTKALHKVSRDSLTPDAANFILASHPQRSRQGSHMTTASSTVIDYGAAQIVQGSHTDEPLVNIISTAECAAASRRRAIQRQTRLLFIYPCVYMIFMVIPFVQHCFNYSDYYAQRPIFAISLISPICYSIMGCADCLVFCWREKPWTNIPGSDGSFLGSFCWWRFLGPWAEKSPTPSSREFKAAVRAIRQGDVEVGPRGEKGSPRCPDLEFQVPAIVTAEAERPGSSGSTTKNFLKTIKVIRPSHKRVFSGHSDQAALAAERAAERLALEREAVAQRRIPATTGGKAKEWYDREEWLSEDDDDDDDEDEDEDEEMEGTEEYDASQQHTTVREEPGKTGHSDRQNRSDDGEP